jgi:acetolactate synthase regulatory subunit
VSAGGPGMSLGEYHAMQAAAMSEDALQRVITAAAQHRGFLVYHTHDSRRSAAGYPDLHLVHQVRGVSMMRELKSAKGTLRPDQVRWIAALAAAGVDVGVWRPMDWFDGTVDRELAAGQP